MKTIAAPLASFLLVAGWGAAARAQDAAPPSPKSVVEKLFAARTADERKAAIDAAVESKCDAASIAAALCAGRSYAAGAPTGWLKKTIVAPDGKKRPYLLYVPEKYDPARRWRMVIDMHGGVSRPKPPDHAELVEVKYAWGE